MFSNIEMQNWSYVFSNTSSFCRRISRNTSLNADENLKNRYSRYLVKNQESHCTCMYAIGRDPTPKTLEDGKMYSEFAFKVGMRRGLLPKLTSFSSCIPISQRRKKLYLHACLEKASFLRKQFFPSFGPPLCIHL